MYTLCMCTSMSMMCVNDAYIIMCRYVVFMLYTYVYIYI